METVQQLLNARGEQHDRYGDFAKKADLIQAIKDLVRQFDGWNAMAADQQEALDMIIHKMGRLVAGNPDNIDSWQDIAGYAMLVANRLK